MDSIILVVVFLAVMILLIVDHYSGNTPIKPNDPKL